MTCRNSRLWPGQRSEVGGPGNAPSISDLSPLRRPRRRARFSLPVVLGVSPMNRCFAFATLAVALVLGSAGSANAFFGLGGNGCGCGCEQSCACEQSCCCEKSCGCEQSCGCENSCCHRCCLSGLCDRVRGMFSCHN